MEHFYQNIQGWFTYPNFYSEVAERFPSKSKIVEIGVWKGTSVSYLGVEFFNRGVLVPAEVMSKDTLYNEDLGEIKGKLIKNYQRGEKVNLLIQPEDLQHDDSSNLKFKVIDKKFRGTSFIYILKTTSNLKLPVFVHSHHQHLHAKNEKFGIKTPIYIDHLVCF